MVAGLKAYVTYAVADGIEAARRACGGHGYLVSSGLVTLLNNYTAMCTLEGTRDVLEQQADDDGAPGAAAGAPFSELAHESRRGGRLYGSIAQLAECNVQQR